MKHVTYGERSLFVDDESADLLMEYARVLAKENDSDTVPVRVIGIDGNEVEATFLLNPSTAIMAETTHTTAQAPTNASAIQYLREQIHLRSFPPQPQPETPAPETPPFDLE